jgi:hypothetical protein
VSSIGNGSLQATHTSATVPQSYEVVCSAMLDDLGYIFPPSGAGTIDLDFHDIIYDVDNAAGSWFSPDGGSNWYNTVAATRTALAAQGKYTCNGTTCDASTFMPEGTALEAGGEGVAGTVLSSSNGGCLNDGTEDVECYQACDETFTIELPDGDIGSLAGDQLKAYIPGWVAKGTAIKSFKLNGSGNRNIGK